MNFAEIIECIGRMDFGCAAFLLYSGITAASTVLFYIVDTPWRKARKFEDICQKAMYTAKYLNGLKVLEEIKRANSIKVKEAKEKKTIDDLEKKKQESIRIARYIDKQKRSIKDALDRAKIQHQLLKEMTDDIQESFSRNDITAIKQQIYAELLTNVKAIIYGISQMDKIKTYEIANSVSSDGRRGRKPAMSARII